ncbi:hypothetical protein F4861DRAFT_517783 [Xylaria intraflava]|nr:hypothetical protein F4861DRAFT_517783 [Xylaria intraflava]
MPGTWPSWADEPNPIPPEIPDYYPIFSPQPARDYNSITHGFICALGGWSATVLGALQDKLWRPVASPAVTAATSASTSALTQTADSDALRSFKRARFGSEMPYGNDASAIQGFKPTQTRYGDPTRNDSLGSNFKRLEIANQPLHRHIIRNDPNFNYDGHFSVDMAYASDSEDEEDLGDPMDIDSPRPVALQTETMSAQQPIGAENASLKPKSFQYPTFFNKMGFLSAQQPISNINAESKPNLNSAVTAARRAVKLFPKDSVAPNSRAAPFANAHVSLESSQESTLAPSAVEEGHNATESPKAADAPSPQKTKKAQYENVLEFFPNDVVHSLPGFEDDGLAVDLIKAEFLKRKLMERLRQEEIDSQNAALSRLGLRRPKSALICNTPPEWVNRAFHAPDNGKFDPSVVHPDAVELQPRDFAKLVPETAWLNDDCVHSSLCCLATYVNKQAGVKPKVDTPKCVPISSLYWTAFCGDHKKLYPRPFGRKWNMTRDNLLNIDTILIPVNSGAHWTLIVIRPSRRTVSYLDSFQRPNEAQLRHAYQWLSLFLGDKFIADDWKTEELAVPKQTNAWDCGVFVITNAMCLALGISPMCYNEDHMPAQRLRIAAMLLNGGFRGEFDLSHL